MKIYISGKITGYEISEAAKKFKESEKAENFFDCPMTREQYVEMLIELGEIKKK